MSLETKARENLAKRPYVSRETMDRLDLYQQLTLKWTAKINLVSKAAQGELWARHFLDSAQIWPLCPENCKSWVDLGSGAGFPGLVIAAIAADLSPDLRMTVVESDARKCAFLRTAAREMGIAVQVENCRVEDLAPNIADVVSARALAPVSILCRYSHKILRNDGVCLFLKGKSCGTELEQAAGNWSFLAEKTPSQTDPEGVILRLKDLIRDRSDP